MTYLQLINAVLRRLREDEVTTLNASYTKLIGDFINETIVEVGNAWNWHSGRTTVVVSTVAGTSTYEVSGAGRYFKYLSVYDNTNKSYLTQISSPYMDFLYQGGDAPSGQPEFFATNSYNSATDNPYIDIYPIPNSSNAIYFNLYIPQATLTNTTDVCDLPSNMIVLGAWAKAISERGEDGGQNTIEQQLMYKSALSDAIAIDVEHSVGETTWQQV